MVSPGVAATLGAKQTPHGGNQKFRENTIILSRLKASGFQEEQVALSASAFLNSAPHRAWHKMVPGQGPTAHQGVGWGCSNEGSVVMQPIPTAME